MYDSPKKTKRRYPMEQYVLAFDLSTRAMRDAGLSKSKITAIYRQEIPSALARCGLTKHPQRSVYMTRYVRESIHGVRKKLLRLRQLAPNMGRFLRNASLLLMPENGDVTDLISGHATPRLEARDGEPAENSAEGKEAVPCPRVESPGRPRRVRPRRVRPRRKRVSKKILSGAVSPGR
jgi:virulence-associated protein VapD